MKIGFLQKWNTEANCVEFSITRLQMAICTLFALFFTYQYYVTEGNSITINSITLILVLFAAAFSPKMIKEIIEKKIK